MSDRGISEQTVNVTGKPDTLQIAVLAKPQQWRAGYTVDANEIKTPFYFDCAECGSLEPVIAAFSTYDGKTPAVRITGPHSPNPDLYCVKCALEKELM